MNIYVEETVKNRDLVIDLEPKSDFSDGTGN